MALANMLAEAGNPAHRGETTATVSSEPVDGAPTITKIERCTEGAVQGIDEAEFKRHADAARRAVRSRGR